LAPPKHPFQCHCWTYFWGGVGEGGGDVLLLDFTIREHGITCHSAFFRRPLPYSINYVLTIMLFFMLSFLEIPKGVRKEILFLR
jgi:hypothetical protein